MVCEIMEKRYLSNRCIITCIEITENRYLDVIKEQIILKPYLTLTLTGRIICCDEDKLYVYDQKCIRVS